MYRPEPVRICHTDRFNDSFASVLSKGCNIVAAIVTSCYDQYCCLLELLLCRDFFTAIK